MTSDESQDHGVVQTGTGNGGKAGRDSAGHVQHGLRFPVLILPVILWVWLPFLPVPLVCTASRTPHYVASICSFRQAKLLKKVENNLFFEILFRRFSWLFFSFLFCSAQPNTAHRVVVAPSFLSGYPGGACISFLPLRISKPHFTASYRVLYWMGHGTRAMSLPVTSSRCLWRHILLPPFPSHQRNLQYAAPLPFHSQDTRSPA